MDLLTKKQKMNSWDVLFFSHCIFIYGKRIRQKVSKCSQKQCIRTTLELWPKISITVQSCSDCLFHLEYLCSCWRMLEMLRIHLLIYLFYQANVLRGLLRRWSILKVQSSTLTWGKSSRCKWFVCLLKSAHTLMVEDMHI